MIIVRSNTARGKALIARAERNEGYYLWDVYGSFSKEKIKAWEKCKRLCYEEHGDEFHICTHCRDNFTVAWKVEDGWRLETYANSYKVVKVKGGEE